MLYSEKERKVKSLSGLPFPSPGDLPISGIEPGSPTLQADALSLKYAKALAENVGTWQCMPGGN